jgi:hypothetical protein
MKRLGPELKMPEFKPPAFLVDLWWDLWDRRLLPLVALLVVATVAVPFLMGSSKEVPQSSLAAIAAAGATPTAASGGASHLAVVEARPGLRDYRKRLNRNRPTDPFMQRFTAPVVKTQVKSSTTSTTSTTSSTSSTSSTSGGGGSAGTTSGPVSSGPSSPSGAPSSGHVTVHHILFTFAADVKISRSGGKEAEAGEKPEEWVKKKVMPYTPLPFKKQPVVTYMGPSKKGKAVLLVSTRVTSASGEGKCLSGEEEKGTCQLLEVEPGFPETFVYGANEVKYTIKVLRIEPVVIRRS